MKNILAIDVGLKRIGLAKYVQNIPLPITPILRKIESSCKGFTRFCDKQ